MMGNITMVAMLWVSFVYENPLPDCFFKAYNYNTISHKGNPVWTVKHAALCVSFMLWM